MKNIFNSFKKNKIIQGVKLTAVRGNKEILLFYANVPAISGGIEIPNGYDVATEVIYEKG